VVLEILSERLAAVVASGEEAETAVLVCGRGSSDPDANADMYKLSRLLHEGRAFPFVETSFIGITRPLLPDGLERCRRLGAQRIVVVPHFLFTGVLHKRIHAQCKTFARAYPGVEVRAAPYIGPDVRIAGLVWERYREAIDGDPRMNCDVCVHRVALPGFEDEVGAPAVPHFHPDEPRAHLHVHGLT
jgi:sirohydrochlorin cobaltochelatase